MGVNHHTINILKKNAMKNLSKLALVALIVAISFEACTKDNSVTPKTTVTSTNKVNSSTTLFRRDTITPLVIEIRKDTITPIKIIIPLIRRDTITPNH